MYDVTVDEGENRLYLRLEGRMERPTLERAASETVDAARELDEDFELVNDISEFRPPSPDDAVPIREAQEQLVAAGLGQVVRVVGDGPSDVVANAFERRSKKVGYEGMTTKTVREAERKLERSA